MMQTYQHINYPQDDYLLTVLNLRKLKGSVEGFELWDLLAYACKFYEFVHDYP